MSVELLDWMGDDLSIVNAARVSYAKESRYACCDDHRPYLSHPVGLSPKDVGLIGYLMREHHGTPFEMVQFKFRVRVPIGVAREWQRHRIGSFNEQSTRYVEMKPDFYIPVAEAVRTQVGKPGHYTFEPLPPDKAAYMATIMIDAYAFAFEQYRRLLHEGVAKELARNVLPLGLMTEFIWSVNLRSLFNFIALRTSPNALYEIREEALAVEQLARDVAPHAMAAFDEHGRVTP